MDISARAAIRFCVPAFAIIGFLAIGWALVWAIPPAGGQAATLGARARAATTVSMVGFLTDGAAGGRRICEAHAPRFAQTDAEAVEAAHLVAAW